MFLPFDYTEADLTYIGDNLEEIEEFWHSIGKPKYSERLSFEDNMLSVFNNLLYWPKPMLNDNVVQTIILEYENDNRRTKKI